ncbi:MAG: hypothetical protein PUI48_05920 [Oscillospiraceae bacterium]|nr:hypothetical protein [Oscillospiraceae bacterium]MDY6208333.1 hypothetical protein [Oscillospiraceae bacterium]
MSGLLSKTGIGKENSAALPIVFENYLKVVKLNVFTGEFHFVKTYQDSRDKEASGSFFEYAEKAVREGTIHKDDSSMFLRYLDSDYLAGRLLGGSGGKHIMLHGLRCRILNDYKNVTMEIIASKNFSREKPWAIMCISFTNKLRSRIGTELDKAYCKIVHVRLSDGYYEPVYMTDSEISAEESLAPGIVNWFASFALAGNVLEEDREKFLEFIDTDRLCRSLAVSGEVQLSYRRKIGGEYRPVCMKIVRSPDYTPETPWSFIYIYEEDTEGKYRSERKKTEKYFGSCDIMTGIRNRRSYDELCREYEAAGRKEPVGVLYARLSAGQEDCEAIRENRRIFALMLMDTFGREKAFRLGENEFAVVSFGGDGESFRRRAANFCSQYRENANRSVMTGFFRDEAAESITSVMEICRENAVRG